MAVSWKCVWGYVWIVFFCLVPFCVFGISLTLALKQILSYVDDLDFPFLLLGSNIVFRFFVSFVLQRCCGKSNLRCSDFLELRAVLVGILSCLDYGFSNVGISFLRVTYYHITKSLVPILILLFTCSRIQWTCRRSILLISSLVLVVGGVSIASVANVASSPAPNENEKQDQGTFGLVAGFFFVLLSCFCCAGKVVLSQVLMEPRTRPSELQITSENEDEVPLTQQSDQQTTHDEDESRTEQSDQQPTAGNEGEEESEKPSYGPVDLVVYSSPGSALLVYFLFLLFDGKRFVAVLREMSEQERMTPYLLETAGSHALLSFLSLFLVLSSYALTKYTSALTLAFAGQGRGVLLLISSALLFGDPWSVWTVFGWSLTMIGIFLYNANQFVDRMTKTESENEEEIKDGVDEIELDS